MENDQSPQELYETRLQYQLRKLPDGAQRESVRLAIALATQELDLEHVYISFEVMPCINIRGIRGDTLPHGNHRYLIRLATYSNDQLVRTVGHELYHVWQFENDVPIDCNTADQFGFDLADEIKWQMEVARC